MGVAVGTRLFKRTAYAVIGKRGQSSGTKVNVRIKFTVEKVSDDQANKISVDLYNLSKPTMTLLEDQDATLQLFAGYSGNTRMLGRGDVFLAVRKRNGPDIIMTAEVMDGGYVRNVVHVEANIGPGGTNQQLLEQVINAAIQADSSIGRGVIGQLPLIQYQKGVAISGPLSKVMDDLVRPAKWTWGIVDGQINVVPINGGTGGVTFLLSDQTGLIDVPSKDTAGPNGGSPLYRVKSLLNPLLNPYDMVQIKSVYIQSGSYQIFRVTHAGDTHEGEFSTALEVFLNG